MIFFQYFDKEDKYWFIFLSMSMKFLTGCGIGIFLTPALSYIPNLYENEIEYVMTLIEFVTGLGLSLGPLVGGFLY